MGGGVSAFRQGTEPGNGNCLSSYCSQAGTRMGVWISNDLLTTPLWRGRLGKCQIPAAALLLPLPPSSSFQIGMFVLSLPFTFSKKPPWETGTQNRGPRICLLFTRREKVLKEFKTALDFQVNLVCYLNTAQVSVSTQLILCDLKNKMFGHSWPGMHSSKRISVCFALYLLCLTKGFCETQMGSETGERLLKNKQGRCCIVFIFWLLLFALCALKRFMKLKTQPVS